VNKTGYLDLLTTSRKKIEFRRPRTHLSTRPCPTRKKNHMKWILFVLICSLTASVPAPGQTPATSATKAAAEKQPPLDSSQELNIRAYIELLRTDVKKQKSQIIGDVMEFDADQAATFWPIYKDFSADLTQIGDQVLALVKDYAANYDNMSNEVADRLATKLLDIEQERNTLKRKYYGRFKSALDPITAVRFLQVENQLERLIDLQIASKLPVINGSGK
jgi:GTP1/Obg family GTP-binding protein